ncbi:hypothetical protein [Brevundimonas sp.]|uniref:hypothetical protein n=1 Tax=Brevundimonas sp. TaxID=1871086 RepID=UPI003D0A4A97
MCLVKKPKVVTSAAAEAKEAPVLRNPYLDGLPSVLRARRGGVQSLTIRRGGASGTANTPTTTTITPTPAKTGGLSDKKRAQATIMASMGGVLGLVGKSALQKDAL